MAPDAYEREEQEVAAVFARLREAVRSRPPAVDGDSRAAAVPAPPRLRARAEAERLWPVTVDRPLERRAGARGTLVRPVKALLRKLMRWYVEPLAADQRAFNDVALKLIDDLFERLRAAHDPRLVAELDERLTRLERRVRSEPAPVGREAAPPLDYFAFEARMRGSTRVVRARQEPYVHDFRGAAPVLDVGCGRGEFLSLLRAAGIEARGVDLDTDMVAYARGEGLDVEQADALAHLEALPDRSLGGIFAAQVVEHLPAPALMRFLELAAAKLRAEGILVAETINPLSPSALRNYFADLTHAQPLVPETLVLLARQAGFARTEIRFVNEPEAEERLETVELPFEPALEPARRALAANTERLNALLFGPQDYALVART